MADALQALEPENVEAWQMFHQLAGRFVVDASLGSVVFARLTEGWTADDVSVMTERLSTIYDVLIPPKQN